MIFNSLEFFVFFAVVLVLYFILPLRYRWVMLLAASYYFYISWNPSLIFLILLTTAVSYISALIIEKNERKSVKKLCMILTLFICLGVLFFFKYFNFMLSTVTDIVSAFGGQANIGALDLILPVGISFYTFQTLSYVIDVYRGSIKAERHFGYYALFVSFFPQLVAGPIERPDNLLPQLKAPHRPERSNISSGITMMLTGYFKKVVVADLLAVYVNPVFNNAGDASGAGVLVAILMFTFQIYCDFSGYTDIAIGCSRIMGIRLMQNFNRPYISESIKEFWGRWHISLSTWFRDYLYIPLGGNRCGAFRHMMNIMIVFLVSGLWHGADWTFVIWGALHGLFQIFGAITKKPRNAVFDFLHIGYKNPVRRAFRKIQTFILASFAWMIFRANNISDLKKLVISLFTDWKFSAGYFTDTFDMMGLTINGALICVAALIIMRGIDAHNESSAMFEADGKTCDIFTVPDTRYVYLIWIIAAAWLLLLIGNGASSFIYFQF